MITEAIQFITEHKAALGVAGAWTLREVHNLWPFVKPSVSLPFLRANGGLVGIVKTIFVGAPAPAVEPKPPTV